MIEVQDEFNEYEERYVNAKSRFSEIIDVKLNRHPEETLNHSSNKGPNRSLESIFERQNEIIERIGVLAVNNRHDELKIPVQKIPTFSGNYRDWSRFKNLFLSKVDKSTRLSDAEKLDYLLSLVTGEALNFIKNFQINDANYSTAWETLLGLYNRPYLIADDIIDALVNAPAVDSKRSNIRNLYGLFQETVDCLDNLGDYYRTRDPWIINLIVRKLDKDTAALWAKEVCEEDRPSVTSLLRLLKETSDSMRVLKKDHSEQHVKSSVKNLSTFVGDCFVCHKNHRIFQCDLFSSMSVGDREKLIKSQSRCINCLGSGHFLSNCQSKRSCNTCKKRHHTLLHSANYHNSNKTNTSGDNKGKKTDGSALLPSNQTSEPSTSTGGILQVNFSTYDKGSSVILPTALVDLYTRNGGVFTCRALLDTGAEVSFITEDCLRRLKLPRSNVRVPIQEIAFSQTYSKGVVSAILGSKTDRDYKISLDLYVMTRLTGNLPDRSVEFSTMSELREKFNLADYNFNTSSPVDLILGADKFFEILGSRKFLDSDNRLYIQESKLGWLVSGGFTSNSYTSINSLSATLPSDDQRLEGLLERFWLLEKPKVDIPVKEEDVKCERNFTETTIRLPNGRFSVNLPLNENYGTLGESYHLSLNRFRGLERKFLSNEDFRKRYVDLINEFKAKGYLELVDDSELRVPVYKRFYLPHYGILRQGVSGVKLRIVFDASMKTENGASLNDVLLPGPNIQSDLRDHLIRFGFHRYVMSADIVKMYRQIRVNFPGRDYQHIFWRESPNDAIQVFRLTTVTDGQTCSPFLALRVIDQIAFEEGARFTLGAEIARSRYMDDFFFGDDDVDRLIEKRNQLSDILASAGMELSKWASNISSIESAESKSINLENSNVVKTLGLRWLTNRDVFTFVYPNSATLSYSRRSLLSEASRIFDPLGYVSPVVIRFKILFQQTWLRKLGWDENVPEEIKSQWIDIRNDLNDLEHLEIPRYMGAGDKITIHGFCDASLKSYASALYTRIEDGAGNVTVRLLCSKTKLAPIKSISIARLELCGAHLLAKTANGVKDNFNGRNPEFYLWSDSKVVLAWLQSPPSRWATFVANRCSHILELMPNVLWGYVPSGQNPADLSSRGCRTQELRSNQLWW